MPKKPLACNALLTDMLRYRRPAWSKTEWEFIDKFIDSVPGMISDQYGNRILLHPSSRTMIACHTDTVHRMGGKQRLQCVGGIVSLAPSERVSNCLGADDTAGIYAALRMIQAGVAATFVFHRAEEIGGKGSMYLADEQEEFVEQFDRCVSLDRRGTQDIITYQAGGECCSGEFASALARQLRMKHRAADGIFTDSANYTHMIPECSNVSVGYQNEHTERETLDTTYLERLITRLCAVKWDSLPTVRKPEMVAYDDDADFWDWWQREAIKDARENDLNDEA